MTTRDETMGVGGLGNGRQGSGIAGEMRDRQARSGGPLTVLRIGIAVAGLALACPCGDTWAGEVVFLKDGRTIQAERTEVIGDRVRIQWPAGEIELPRSAILTIHEATSPGSGATSPPPAKVYPGFTQEMNERVRQELQQGRTSSRP